MATPDGKTPVSTEQLISIIGLKEVELIILRQQIVALTAATTETPKEGV